MLDMQTRIKHRQKKRDHWHVTGKFGGAAHNKCSLKLRIPRKLPIIFYNL